MIVREANFTDKETIAAFQLAMALETESLQLNLPTVLKGADAVFKDRSKGIYYVAEINGELVGSLMITFEWSDWRNGVVWWIQSVYIKPEYRRKGIYSKMYKYVKDIVMNDERIKGLRLYVDNTNIKAQKVYAKLGMDGTHYSTFEWMK